MPMPAAKDDEGRDEARSMEYYKGMVTSKPSADDGERDMLTPTLKLAGGASALLAALRRRGSARRRVRRTPARGAAEEETPTEEVAPAETLPRLRKLRAA